MLLSIKARGRDAVFSQDIPEGQALGLAMSALSYSFSESMNLTLKLGEYDLKLVVDAEVTDEEIRSTLSSLFGLDVSPVSGENEAAVEEPTALAGPRTAGLTRIDGLIRIAEQTRAIVRVGSETLLDRGLNANQVADIRNAVTSRGLSEYLTNAIGVLTLDIPSDLVSAGQVRTALRALGIEVDEPVVPTARQNDNTSVPALTSVTVTMNGDTLLDRILTVDQVSEIRRAAQRLGVSINEGTGSLAVNVPAGYSRDEVMRAMRDNLSFVN